MEREPAGLIAEVEGRGLGIVKRGRRCIGGGPVHDREFGEAAVREDGCADHPLADLEAAYALSQSEDVAAELDARGEGHGRTHLVHPPAHEDVRKVRRRGPHLNEDLARPGFWVRCLPELEHVDRLTEFEYLPCPHQPMLPSSTLRWMRRIEPSQRSVCAALLA